MSMDRWTWVLAILSGLLGAVHVALTPLAFPGWTIDALWFVGAGLAILIAAAANVLGLLSPGGRGRMLLIAINLTMAGFFVAAWTILPGPQVIVGGAVFLILVCTNLAGQSTPKDAG